MSEEADWSSIVSELNNKLITKPTLVNHLVVINGTCMKNPPLFSRQGLSRLTSHVLSSSVTSLTVFLFLLWALKDARLYKGSNIKT